MFDVSFSELLIIGIVALLVIGPEKLPKVARTVGAFTGRMQRYVSQMKEEVNRDLRFEELQKLQQEIQTQANQLKNVAQTQVNDLIQTVETNFSESNLAQESLEAFELTPVAESSRKLSQFKKRPSKPVDTPLFADLPAVPTVKKSPAAKVRTSKTIVKEAAKKSAAKKTVSKKPTTQVQ
ncbi:MAG TPA: Sec-independent protein translocase protein TatB [Methylotenera sp.]|nr:Sec-independent protein translocase protein TatB [Methylotenera sp.]HPH06561.1 Sec-independent protein translocase protein TatB [Methylotenera sp.]HPN01890.1 Sec-independent protein translocase protein TatB [Methylotenera sp.]